MTRTEVLDAIVLWANARKDVEALVHTGSLVRPDNRADEFSDLDIEIIAAKPASLAAKDGWLTDIGELITVLRLDEEDQDWPTRLAIFEDGVKVDFTIAGRRRIAEMSEAGLDPLYERGYRVLLDKSGITKDLPAPSHRFPVPLLPSPQEFRERVEEFWFEAFHVPKYLSRGELFLAKQRDWTMKELLLEMIEWHAVATNHKPVDVWHNGTRLKEWTDPETWHALQEAFGRFDAKDQKRAFEQTAELYSRLGREVAACTGLPYPQEVEDKIRALVSVAPTPA